MRTFFFLLCLTVAFACKKSTTPPPAMQALPGSIGFTFLSPGITGGMETLFFVNPAYGFVGTWDGGIYKTVDSGKTWAPQHSTVTDPVYSLFFLDDKKGFAVGGQNSCSGGGCTPAGAFILGTIDGGQTWTRLYTPANKVELSSICFVNALTGFAVGDNVICRTTDGGQTWDEYKVTDLGGKMMQVAFSDSKKGYVVCLNDRIVQTTDGGDTWTVTSTHRNIGYITLSTAGGVIYVGGQGAMIKSANNGSSWNDMAGSPSDLFSMHFIDVKKGFAFGRGNYSGGDFGVSYASIFYTSDGGSTWGGSKDIKDAGMIIASSFPSDRIGYALGGNKIIRINVN